MSGLDENRIHRVCANVDMRAVDLPGRVLDVGGGGEGIVGQLLGDRVVAIDRMKEELLEAAPGPLKIIMDARDLQFLDGTFDAATAFFSFMYMDRADLPVVLREIRRVLKPGATLSIWDAVIPPRDDSQRDAFFIQLVIALPARNVETGYGVWWNKSVQDARLFTTLATETGFSVAEAVTEGHVMRLVLRAEPA
ncbi:MAG: class I SAM-dependent methyltransferase [Chloroflexota bacterium]